MTDGFSGCRVATSDVVATRFWAAAVIVLMMTACAGESDTERAVFTAVREFEPPAGGAFWAPIDLVATSHHVWVLDAGAAQVYGYSPDGTYQTTVGQPGAGPGELKEPLALGVTGDTLWVLNAGNRRIEFFAASANSLGTALGSRPLPDSLPPPLDIARLGDDWYATTPFLPQPVVRFHQGDDTWTSFGAEVVEAAAELTPRDTAIPDAYRIEVEGDRLWLLHLYLPVLGVYDRNGKMERVVTYPGEDIEAQQPVEQDGGEGRVRRLIRAPRTPAGSLGFLRVGTNHYVLTHQRNEGRQKIYRLDGDEPSRRATLMPSHVLFLTSIRSHGSTYAIGAKGELDEPAVFVLR